LLAGVVEQAGIAGLGEAFARIAAAPAGGGGGRGRSAAGGTRA